jgi:potassium inwardly-rectifying channel subfamily J
MHKSGHRNTHLINLQEKSRRFLKDLVHTLVEAQWRFVLLFFAIAFFGTWLFFAVLYWLIAWSHGDLEFDIETGQRLGEGKQPCIVEAKTFAGFFLFSVESQVTTGFGTFFPTEECHEAIFVLITQLILGLIVDSAIVGIFYVKIIRPPKYADCKFSKKAVICQRDTKLCLLFRVCDFNKAHLINTKIRAYLFEEKITVEGEHVGKSQQRLKLENNGKAFLIWPQIVCHFIDETSPFYDMSAKDLIERRFEIIVTLTGVSLHTGQMSQSRASYMSHEIMWGYRFDNVISYNSDDGRYEVQIDKIDSVVEIETVLCSANCLQELSLEIEKHLKQKNPIHEHDSDDDDDDVGIAMKNNSK